MNMFLKCISLYDIILKLLHLEIGSAHFLKFISNVMCLNSYFLSIILKRNCVLLSALVETGYLGVLVSI